jgi:hypothetical protein
MNQISSQRGGQQQQQTCIVGQHVCPTPCKVDFASTQSLLAIVSK